MRLRHDLSTNSSCDGEVILKIGCCNMLTRMYRTGCRQHYSRKDREHLVTNKFILNFNKFKTKKIEQHTLTHKTQCSEEGTRAVSGKELKPTKLMCQLRLQSYSHTYPIIPQNSNPTLQCVRLNASITPASHAPNSLQTTTLDFLAHPPRSWGYGLRW
jgi:hypothetical protein